MSGAAHAKNLSLGLPMIAAGLGGMVLFVWMQTRRRSPLLDITLLSRNRYFTMSCLAAMGNYAATFGIISLFMGTHEITPDTLPAYLLSMRTGLVAYAVFSAMGVILSVGRGKKRGEAS